MPVLKNPRHERFAQELAKGKTADEAYQIAGYKANRGNAATLKAKKSISNRRAEIQTQAASRAEVTIASLTDELEEARSSAMANGREAAAVSATHIKAKINGKIIDHHQIVHQIDLSTLNDAEFAELRRVRSIITERGSIRLGGAAPGGSEAAEDRGAGRRLQS